MSDWFPCIVRLGKIENHPNGDNLEVTTIMDEYPAILRKGQYKEDQLVSFIPYDSIVPDTEEFYFLSPINRDSEGNILGKTFPIGQVPEKYRIVKAKKIRGIYSDCLVVDAPSGFQEGDSIIDFFNIKKREYEEELPDNEVDPKTFSLFKYDLEGAAKYSHVFEEGESVLIHEKIEGENCTIVYLEDKLWVRSRNFFKKEDDYSHWWDVPKKLGLKDKLKNFQGLAIWGELYGGIKHFKYDCSVVNNKINRKIRVFDIWNVFEKRFLNWDEVENICNQLDLETVPMLYKGPWKTDRSLHLLSEGKSTIGNCLKEGWVMRSDPEKWHSKLGRKIIKLKSKEFKLFKG